MNLLDLFLEGDGTSYFTFHLEALEKHLLLPVIETVNLTAFIQYLLNKIQLLKKPIKTEE